MTTTTETAKDAIIPELERRINECVNIAKYMLAGKSTFTIRSVKTQKRYTYKVIKSKLRSGQNVVWFVKVMYGPNNEQDFRYIGVIRMIDGAWQCVWTGKSAVPCSDVTLTAFNFLLKAVQFSKTLPPNLEFWHSGRCGRCGKKLTVPSSIEMGLGPECAGKL